MKESYSFNFIFINLFTLNLYDWYMYAMHVPNNVLDCQPSVIEYLTDSGTSLGSYFSYLKSACGCVHKCQGIEDSIITFLVSDCVRSN